MLTASSALESVTDQAALGLAVLVAYVAERHFL